MNPLWSYLWPLLAAGLFIGALAGSIAFRKGAQIDGGLVDGRSADRTPGRRKRWIALAAGAVASLAATGLWYGPMGASALFTSRVERAARITLDNYEMPRIASHLYRTPLSRRLILSGEADDFQRSELARILGTIPGIREVRWSSKGGGLPLIAESALVALLGFLLGLLLAYLVELRRRYNAQWNW